MTATPTIESLHAAWVAAFNSHDLDAHMACYTKDATLFGSVDDLQIGIDAIRAYFSKVPAAVRVKAYKMPRVSQISPDVAVTAGHVDFANGDAPMPYRMTWCSFAKTATGRSRSTMDRRGLGKASRFDLAASRQLPTFGRN